MLTHDCIPKQCKWITRNFPLLSLTTNRLVSINESHSKHSVLAQVYLRQEEDVGTQKEKRQELLETLVLL